MCYIVGQYSKLKLITFFIKFCDFIAIKYILNPIPNLLPIILQVGMSNSKSLPLPNTQKKKT